MSTENAQQGKGDERVGERLNVRIQAEELAMLMEMLEAWYPGRTRMQGAVVGRAIRTLHKQFKRDQAR